jgi:hypothetical protein
MAKALNQEIAENEDFFDAGGDSLAAEQVLLSLSASLQFDVPGWLLLDHPSAAELAAAIIGGRGRARHD